MNFMASVYHTLPIIFSIFLLIPLSFLPKVASLNVFLYIFLTMFSKSLQYLSEKFLYIGHSMSAQTTLTSLASSIREDGKSLFLTLRESERIHQWNLPSISEIVSRWGLSLTPIVLCVWTFFFKIFEGSVCNPCLMIQTFLHLH